MAHLWIQSASGWNALGLNGAGFDLASLPMKGRLGAPAGLAGKIVQAGGGGAKVWALVAARDVDVRVNCREVLGGLCVLADRDEIRAGGEVCYFSAETLPAAEAFPGLDRLVFCGRCRQQINALSLAVCCPGCGIWYNQSPDLPCWTYSDKCAFCGHPTALDSGFTWTPEEDYR